MSIEIVLSKYPLISYTPNDFPQSLSKMVFTQVLPSKNLYHEYSHFKLLNLFELIDFNKIFRDFEVSSSNDINQENLVKYIMQSLYKETIYRQINIFLDYKIKNLGFCLSDYIYEEEVEKCFQYVIDNLYVLFIQWHELKETIKIKTLQQSSYNAFSAFVKHLIPLTNILYAHSRYDNVKICKLDMYYSNQTHREMRNNIGEFVFAGSCGYNGEIFINTYQWHIYRLFGNKLRLRTYSHIYFHELGHSVELPRPGVRVLKQWPWSNKHPALSQYPQFSKYLKQSYMNKKKVKTKKNGSLSYFICPKFEVNTKPHQNSILIDWERSSQEAFAESFGYLCYWYLNGIGKADILLIDGHSYKNLIIIKTLMPILKLLAVKLNWEFIGIPKHLIPKRKKMIMAYLKYVEDLKEAPRNTNIKNMRADNVKKPTLQKLLRKQLK